MATPGYIQIMLKAVQNSLARPNVEGTGPAEDRKVVDEIQNFLNSRFPERPFFVQNGENWIGREDMSINHGIGQRVPGTYESNSPLPPLPDGHLSGGGPVTDMTNPPPNVLYPRIPTEVAAAQDPETSVVALTSRVHELTAENEHLKKSLERGAAETTELTSKLNNAMQERDDLGRQRQTNLLKIRRLNDMIIKNSQNSDEPLDDEVLQDMFKVRNMTTDIIKRFYPDEVTFRGEMATDLAKRFNSHYYSDFYRQQLYPDKNPERRRRLLISFLFLELQSLFFGPNARRFGLPENMEGSFKELERLIERSSKVPAEETVEWRTRTVLYAGRLDLGYHETIEKSTNHLFTILEPMTLQGEDRYGNADKRQLAGLKNALRELCSAALKLSLRFRSSKTKYEFKMYPNNTSLPACGEGLVKMLDSEGPISKPMDPNKLRIFCTLFGALVKTRPSVSGQASDPVVLEAGNVIVYEAPPCGPPQ